MSREAYIQQVQDANAMISRLTAESDEARDEATRLREALDAAIVLALRVKSRDTHGEPTSDSEDAAADKILLAHTEPCPQCFGDGTLEGGWICPLCDGTTRLAPPTDQGARP